MTEAERDLLLTVADILLHEAETRWPSRDWRKINWLREQIAAVEQVPFDQEQQTADTGPQTVPTFEDCQAYSPEASDKR